jgi:hypothetical protein
MSKINIAILRVEIGMSIPDTHYPILREAQIL